MFKNLVKKIKGAAKKVAPYAGVIAGMFGAGPLMSAGIGALGGGFGTGNMKGAVLGGLGGYGAGTMWGGKAGYPGGNRLFGNPLNIFNDKPFFNPDNQGIMNLLTGTRPEVGGMSVDIMSKPIPAKEVFDTATNSMITMEPAIPSKLIGTHTPMSTGLGRFKDALTMTNNPFTGEALKKGSMYRFLPAALGGTALAYGLGAFDEEPVPEEEIPTEYVYDAATDPLKNVNKRFQDYYQGITQIPSSSIYGYLQSIGALKEGGVPRGYSAGGSMAQKMDIPGQFLLNDPSKTPLSVLEAADGVDTSVTEITNLEEGNNNVDMMMTLRKYQQGELSDDEFFEITGVRPPDMNFTDWMTIEEMQDSLTNRGIQGLERYVDTGEGEGIDKGLGATKEDIDSMQFLEQGINNAKKVLNLGAEEAMKELGTTGTSIGPAAASTVSDDGKRMLDLTKGQQKAVRDGATQVEMTDNQEKFYAAPPPDPKNPEDQTIILNNMVFRMLNDPDRIEKLSMEGDEDYLRKYNFELTSQEQFEIGRQFAMDAGISTDDPRFEDIMSIIITESENIGNIKKEGAQPLFNKLLQKFFPKNANGGLAAFDQGGQIMGPGTGREDVIPGKIVDNNTGQTSDMLVSNNEHIIPEYALYAMGGGDTKKGHDMMDALRKQTKPMAKKMGYDFKGAEDGSVMYG